MSDEATRSEEQAVVESFRQRMAEPNDGTNQVQVVNESLGQLLDGTKIQYAPGPGRELSPAPRGAERWARRERRRLEAQEAARKRAQKGRDKTVLQRVAEQSKKIQGRNVTDTVEYIDGLGARDAQYAVLAEELGEHRVGVLSGARVKVGAKLRAAFEAERAEHSELFEESAAERNDDHLFDDE